MYFVSTSFIRLFALNSLDIYFNAFMCVCSGLHFVFLMQMTLVH